jgi:hypothetical protein
MATHGEIRWPSVGSFHGRLWGDFHGRRQSRQSGVRQHSVMGEMVMQFPAVASPEDRTLMRQQGHRSTAGCTAEARQACVSTVRWNGRPHPGGVPSFARCLVRPMRANLRYCLRPSRSGRRDLTRVG